MSLALPFDLSPCIDLHFPDFEKHYENGLTSKAYGFEAIDCREWHRQFVDRVFAAQENRQFLPIYRINHGEFVMAIGYRYPQPWYRRSLRQNIGSIIYKFSTPFKSGAKGYGFESYSIFELPKARRLFLTSLQEIAQSGILSIAFHNSVDGNANTGNEQYILPFLNWLSIHNINLNFANYFHFYSVYALLHGGDREKLIKNKNILVVTSLNPEKKKNISKNLEDIGANTIQFISVSRDKAIFNLIDTSTIENSIDLVMVGAGTGSARLMLQLKPLNTVCIDAGFCLDTLANPDLRWNRPFCIPDNEFDLAKLKF